MKIWTSLVCGFAMLFATSSLPALVDVEPGEYEFAVEGLCMFPSIDFPYFATKSPDFPIYVTQYDRRAISQPWLGGYRLEGIYGFCGGCNDVRLRWTHFPCRQFSDIAKPDAVAANGSSLVSDYVKSKSSFNFYYLDLLFGQTLFNSCPFFMDLQAGLQYVHLHFDQFLEISPPTFAGAINSFHSHRWGIGPEIGLEARHQLLSCLGIAGRVYSGFLTERKNTAYFNGPLDGKANDSPYWLFVPYLNFRLGLSYDHDFVLCSCCFGLNFEAGYEYISYDRGIDRIFDPSFGGGSRLGSDISEVQTIYSNFAMQGFYLRCNTSF